MSQHDFNIANQTASALRSDLNSALTALASLSSGATAPSTTYANMLWYDTANNQIKKRNEADSAWIVLGTIDEAAGTFLQSAAGIPSGAVQMFAMNSAPSGWLKCNGAAVSRTTYASLFAAIGTTFGAGDGSTSFNLPDLRGEFARGWDDGRGVDSGRVFGSSQSDELKAHRHSFNTNGGTAGGGGDNGIARVGGSPGSATFGYPPGGINETGGTETRPRNVALLYCIKA
jgi:microcystin-dependent protein